MGEEFERIPELEVTNAALARGPDIQTLRLGLFMGGDRVYAEAFVRGERVLFFAEEWNVTSEEFVGLGEAYWNSFATTARR